jgi:hypothetical protein
MSTSFLIALAAIYAAIYYLAARRLLAELKDIDKDYYQFLGAHGGIGPSNSNAIIKMIFDEGVPKEFYPKSFKNRLMLVRLMLYVSPLVLIAIFFAL